MTDNVDNPPIWDLEQYSVGEVRRRRAEARAADPKEGTDDTITQEDDGDWLAPAKEKRRPRFVESGEVFWVAFTGGLLCIVTLGFYRFWLVTRLRKVFANSIRVDGDPIEYTGSGWEKMIGFLIAITMLAIYLGIANVLLLFAGIASFDAASLFTPFSLIALAPFLFWARYRGQRYIMGRLRWRGIRFGLTPGAWGYMLRSLLWSIPTIVTLGLLYPYQHFCQSRYITNRTHFGNIRCEQRGSWLGLMAYWIWLYIAAGMLFLFGWGLAEEMRLGEQGIGVLIAVLWPIMLLVVALLFMNYQIGAFRYLWDNRVIGKTEVNNDLSTGGVIWAYIKGSFLTSMLSFGVTLLFGGLIVGGGFALTSALFGGWDAVQRAMDVDFVESIEAGNGPPVELLWKLAPLWISLMFAYFFAFVVYYAFTQSLITQPIIRLKVEGTTLINPNLLMKAQQRKEDKAGEAGGFADALGVDVGAGFG